MRKVKFVVKLYLLRRYTELVVESVVPDLLHVVPVGDDPVLDGVLELEDPPLGLGLVSNVDLLLSHAGHVSLVLGTAHDGREDTSGGVISGEPGLAHSGPIVHDKSLNFSVTHLGLEQRLLGPVVKTRK